MTHHALPESLSGLVQDELVTHSRVDFATLPSGRTLALLTLDNGSERVPNTFGPAGLSELRATLERLRDGGYGAFDAVAVTGSGGAFAAGADLGLMERVPDREAARDWADLGHDALDRLGRFDVPTFALIDGVALGGGYELALRADWRIASPTTKAIGLPEVHIGLIPGWGGVTLLPRLVGPVRAAEVIVRNPMLGNHLLNARNAFEFGLVDGVAAEGAWPQAAFALVDRWLDHPPTRALPGAPTAGQRDELTDLLDGLRAAHGARKHSFTTACELLEDTLGASTRHAYAAETEAISSLQMHPQFAATLVTFAYQRLDRKHPIAEDVLAAVSKELDAVREATAGVAPLDPDALGALAAEAVSRVRVRVAGIEDLTIDRAAVLAGWPGELGPVTSATPGLLRALLAPPA